MSPERASAATALIDSIDAKRNLPLGIAAGAGAAIVGALIWSAITATTHYQIGFMAIGVAYLVGFAVNRAGSGRTKTFGYAGGALSLAGSMLGNFLVGYALYIAHGASVSQVIANVPFSDIVDHFVRSFDPMDLLFYGIAAYYGYHNSIRRLTKEEVAALPA